MKSFKKVIVIMLTIFLMMGALTACKKKPASLEEDSGTIGNVNNPVSEGALKNDENSSSSVTNNKNGDKGGKYLNLLNKAKNLDNFYSQVTLFMNQQTQEREFWVKGNRIKTGDKGDSDQQRVQYYDSDKKEVVACNGNNGYKMELGEEEIERLKMSVIWGGLQYEYFSEEGFAQIISEKEEDFNGVQCAYIELKTFEGDVLKTYISKEYGVVMKYEHYSRGGEKVGDFTRQLFEMGKVTDGEVEIPEGISIE